MYLCQRLGPSPASVPTAVAAFAIKLLIVTHKKKGVVKWAMVI